jgi:Co/Zn/Cd efflux system component
LGDSLDMFGDAAGAIGLLTLIANTGCPILLVRHRRDDINIRSAWLCSRNDIIANVAVLGAALMVRILGSLWADVLVGTGVAALFILSAVGELREGLLQLRTETVEEGNIA